MAGHAPYLTNVMIGVLPLGVISIFLVLLVAFPFADTTILVALDMDFHRNTFRWRQTRTIVYLVFCGEIAVILALVSLTVIPNPPSWVSTLTSSAPFQDQFLAIIGGTLGFGLIVLIAAGRRTSSLEGT